MKLIDALSLALQPHTGRPDVLGLVGAILSGGEGLYRRLKTSKLGRYAELRTFNATGDLQSAQDDASNKLFFNALRKQANLGGYLSEESGEFVSLGSGDLIVAIDPFDGSRAFQNGIPAGTIFAIFDRGAGKGFLHGRSIVAAGVIFYGLRLEAIICIGGATFWLDTLGPARLEKLGSGDRFYCANLSNLHRWPAGWGEFFTDKVISPPVGASHNMRWFGSLAAHAKALIYSGGLFAYPPDRRADYSQGHLRLHYEAMPMAYIFEALGGAASNGHIPILECKFTEAHARTPLILGESGAVAELVSSIHKHGQQ